MDQRWGQVIPDTLKKKVGVSLIKIFLNLLGENALRLGCFKWNNEFTKNLLILKDFVIRGYITCYCEGGEYLKYKLFNGDVERCFDSLM